MNKSLFRSALLGAAALTLSVATHAQSVSPRQPGWEAGADLIYQDAKTLHFKGGTTADLDTDYGLSITFGYRISAYMEAQFALDWASVDYDASIVTGTGSRVRASGTYDAFTPRANFQLNFMDSAITPFAMGGIGYAFIDTDIPTGRPQTGCWWDPWYGYICTTVQPTKSTDGFAYQLGLGGRWDVTDNTSLRLAWERHWVDFGSEGSPYVDQIKLGFSYRY